MIRAIVLVGSLAIVAISVLALAGGDSEEGGAPPLEPPPETVDAVSALPSGWKVSDNRVIGVAVGVPPRWRGRTEKNQTLLRSPGSAAVVSVTADRTANALRADLADYALEVAAQIGGPDAKVAEAPRPALGYEAAAARSGKTEVIVVRRPELAAYPMLVARNPKVKAGELDAIVEVIVASLRGRPVSAG